jgi:ParB/RepB/Spo0J family partition protein
MEDFKTKLDQFNPAFIDFDHQNPRGETEETIINDNSFRGLTDSIKIYGILEPIIIKKHPARINRYLLVDGERRLRAAKILNLKQIPALLIEDDADGKILAYHVHMLRKQWGKAAETKSIKRIIADIQKSTPNLSEQEIKKRIKEVTKSPQSRINDLYILIKYDDKYIDLVAEEKLDISYLIQGQTSFINRLISKFPELLQTFPENRIRGIIAEKSINKLIPGTRYWMDTFRDVFIFDQEREKIKEILIEFLEDNNLSAEETFSKFENIRKLLNGNTAIVESDLGFIKPILQTAPNKSNSKKNSLNTVGLKDKKQNDSSINTNQNKNYSHLDYSPIKLSQQQQTSIQDIRDKFEKISKTLSEDEKEYIAEAIHCLENQCFKASILMIWATGISRILSYISSNISDFTSKSQEMKNQNTSFYKHHCNTFQTNAKSIDDIRHSSKDIQLLCYLTYIGKIDETHFKKLKANYDIRNDCAHPTTIKLKINETVAIFENVLDLIINNNLLK